MRSQVSNQPAIVPPTSSPQVPVRRRRAQSVAVGSSSDVGLLQQQQRRASVFESNVSSLSPCKLNSLGQKHT